MSDLVRRSLIRRAAAACLVLGAVGAVTASALASSAFTTIVVNRSMGGITIGEKGTSLLAAVGPRWGIISGVLPNEVDWSFSPPQSRVNLEVYLLGHGRLCTAAGCSASALTGRGLRVVAVYDSARGGERTAAGIGVWSTLHQFRRAYPHRACTVRAAPKPFTGQIAACVARRVRGSAPVTTFIFGESTPSDRRHHVLRVTEIELADQGADY